MSTPNGPISFDDLRKEFLTSSSTDVSIASFQNINRGVPKTGSPISLNNLKGLYLNMGYIPSGDGAGNGIMRWNMKTDTGVVWPGKTCPDGHLHSFDNMYSLPTAYKSNTSHTGTSLLKTPFSSGTTTTTTVVEAGVWAGTNNAVLGSPTVANTPNSGYVLGGYANGDDAKGRNISKVTFSNDTYTFIRYNGINYGINGNGDGAPTFSYGDRINYRPGYCGGSQYVKAYQQRFTVSTELSINLGDGGLTVYGTKNWGAAVQTDDVGYVLHGQSYYLDTTTSNYYIKHTKSTEVLSFIQNFTYNDSGGYSFQSGTTAWTSGNPSGGFKFTFSTETAAQQQVGYIYNGFGTTLSNTPTWPCMGGWQSGGWY